MIAYRTTWIIKEGRMQEALELITRNTEQVKHIITENVVVRIYTPDLSPNVLVFEEAFDSVEEHDHLWAAYDETPQAETFRPKWQEVVERRAGTDRWHMAEWRG